MPTALADIEPAWLTLARGELGVREGRGTANNATVLRYYADAGHPEIEHDEVAWCAAFVGAMLERSGFGSTKELTARSYLTWGKPLDEPRVGAIVVFKRGKSAWQGHVGIVVAYGDGWVDVLGGNQGDAVSVQRFAIDSRLLGFRWPVTAENSRTVIAAVTGATGGAISTAAQVATSAIPPPETLAQMAEAGSTFATSLGALADFLPVVSVVAAVITVLSAAVCLYARLDDLAKKGR